jgi:hypothetical protein
MNLSFKISGVDEAIESCGKKVVQKAMKSTLKRLGQMMKTEADKKIREEYNIKKKDLKGTMQILPTKGKGMKVTLRVKGRRIPLIAFGAKQKKEGVQVQILKGGGKKIIPHTFIATMKYEPTVFERMKEGGKRVGRFPVKGQYGPSVPILFKGVKVMGAVQKVVKDRAQDTFNNRLKYFREQKGREIETGRAE